MKKNFFRFSVFAIAYLTFISPVFAEYRLRDLRRASDHLDDLKKRGTFDIFIKNIDYQEKANIFCYFKDFDLAMDELKLKDYTFYAMLIYGLNYEQKSRDSIISFLESIQCSNGNIKYPFGL